MAPNNTEERHQESAATETTPLLAVSEADPTAQLNGNGNHRELDGKPVDTAADSEEEEELPTHREDDTPLPRAQIFLLCYASLVEPMAYFSIFPFVNQMIEETGIPQENVGFWSGLIESLFSLVQMTLMIFYGRVADRLGRKPVLVFSLAGVSIATALFGTATGLWQMIAFRCLAGAFAGSVVTVRAMISENCTAKTQARAFSFFSFARNIAILIGPLIGGGLAKPAEQYPRIFTAQIFKDYPYALATCVTGAVAASATILSALFIRETLSKKAVHGGSAVKQLSTWEILKTPGVGMVMFIYGNAMLLGLAFTATVPVFVFTKPQLGGFGWSPQYISIYLALAGGSQALWTLLAFPPLQHRFGTGGVLRGCVVVWPIFFLIFPLCNELLRHDLIVPFWIITGINSVTGNGCSMAFTAVQLALNDIAPSPSTLGTLNALALTLNSALRAVAPALFSALFATGVRLGWIDGHLVWVVLIPLALGMTVVSNFLPKKAEGRPHHQCED